MAGIRPVHNTPIKVVADGRSSLCALEAVCTECEGAGEIPAQRIGKALHMGHRCNSCFGTGTIATEEGRQLLAFLQRHGR